MENNNIIEIEFRDKDIELKLKTSDIDAVTYFSKVFREYNVLKKSKEEINNKNIQVIKEKERNIFVHKGGITDSINKLIEEKYFSNPKILSEITKELNKILSRDIPTSSVHPILLSFKEKGILDRRLNTNGIWEYFIKISENNEVKK